MLVSLLAADISGKWEVTAQAPNGRATKAELILKEDGGKITGTLGNERGAVDVAGARLDGSDLTFKLDIDSGFSVKLTVAGDSMKGTATSGDGAVWQVTVARPGRAAATSPVTGKWKLIAIAPDGEHSARIEFKEEEGKLAGAILLDDGASIPLREVKLEGRELSFQGMAQGGVFTMKLTVSGDSMKGTFSSAEGATGTVTATR
jgi:hypothetical protein